MIDENINLNIKLRGQYKFNIIENNNVVYSTPWCNNTILSGGLVDLYSNSIPDMIQYLDIGTSNQLPGLSGYGLSGVMIPSIFTNILRDDIETYQEAISSKSYYTSFTSSKALSSVEIKEFAIKKSNNSSQRAFARNTFIESFTIIPNQIINFEYKLTVSWGSTTTTQLPMTGNSVNYTYTIPVTSTTYNIPYDRVFYNNNYLFLISNVYDEFNILQTSLPAMGDAYPYFYDWGIRDSTTSIYSPTEILSSINNTTRTFNVTTLYKNITCSEDAGVFNNITTAVLVKDADVSSYNHLFNATRFAFPLAVYNDFYTCVVPLENQTITSSGIPKFNILSLTYTYTWSEC